MSLPSKPRRLCSVHCVSRRQFVRHPGIVSQPGSHAAAAPRLLHPPHLLRAHHGRVRRVCAVPGVLFCIADTRSTLTTSPTHSHACLPSIYESMAQPQHYDRMLDVTWVVLGVVYGGIGVIGYLMYGDDTQDEVRRPAASLLFPFSIAYLCFPFHLSSRASRSLRLA